MQEYNILAVSDTDVLKKFSVSQLKEKFRKVDFIVSAGDVSNEYLDYLFSALDKDVIYVNGNHVYQARHDISFLKNIDGKVIKYKGLKILGLDGSKVYSFKEHQYTEKQMKRRIFRNRLKVLLKKPDIVITHAPPRGIHDKEDHVHQGFEVFRTIISDWKPKLWIHGHIHLKSHYEVQESIIDETRVVNAYGYKIIKFEA